MSGAFEHGYRAHTVKKVLAAVNRCTFSLDGLEWGEHPKFGQCMLVRMGDPSCDVIIAPSHEDPQYIRYDVIPAYYAPDYPREGLDANKAREVARRIRQFSTLPSGEVKTEFPLPIVGGILSSIQHDVEERSANLAPETATTPGQSR